MKKGLSIVVGIIVVIVILGFVFADELTRFAFRPNQPVEEEIDNQDSDVDREERDVEPVSVVAENLEIPWDIVFLPDGSMLVTERPGRLLQIDSEGTRQTIAEFAVTRSGEGGLLGLALHPDFAQNRFLYLYITDATSGEILNRVERYVFEDGALSDKTVIIGGIPGARYHDGGQLAFGPDDYLYITTGDAGDSELAQDLNSLAGKILRVGEGGEIPEDNPFFRGDHELEREAGFVYSYGHRNPQGLAWDSGGNLWSTEHGRSGIRSGLDEINKIEAGKNYGWPIIQGDENQSGLEPPVLHSGPDITWAPASAAIIQNTLYFGGLRGETLYAFDLAENTLTAHFTGQFGRLRAAALGPDGMLYITTSNRDGRGNVRQGDDKILRIDPGRL